MLLDTHVMLWLVAVPARLGQRCRERIEMAPQVYVSSITHAELAIKAALGRISVPVDLPTRLQEQGLQALPWTDVHASMMSEFPELARHDPFDRMLLAQASRENLTFVTADRRLLELDRPWILDARR